MKRSMTATICLLMSAVFLFSCGGGTSVTGESSGADESQTEITWKKKGSETGNPADTDPKNTAGSSAADTDVRFEVSEMRENDFSTYGFQVDSEGNVLLNGKPYYGYGVNFYPAFIITLDRVFDTYNSPEVELYIKKLAEYKIPYFRMNFGLYYGKDEDLWLDKNAHEKYFEAADRVVGLCEKYHVGIIASLFWNVNAMPDYCSEPLINITDPESETSKLQQKYVEEIVGRYRNSPAIFAWEVGNELNLACEICTYKDENGVDQLVTTDMLNAYYKLIGETIRKYDSVRLITGGDSLPRDNAMALYKSAGQVSGPNNTSDDIRELFKLYTPAPLNCQSVHYPSVSMIRHYREAARQNKTAFYVGEIYSNARFDNPGDKLSPEESKKEKNEQDSWKSILKELVKQDVQIMTYWTYGSYSQAKAVDIDSLELGAVDGFYQNMYVVETINEVNGQFIADGKNDGENYWKNVRTSLFY